MLGQTDHRFVRGQLRQGTGIDAVDLKKVGRGLHGGPLISVKVGLAFGDMKGICGRYFVEIAIAVKINV